MLGFLCIEEIDCDLSSGAWRLRLTFQERIRECTLYDPILELAGTEEDLVWLLEQHPTLYPYDRKQAQRCTSMVEDYGTSLAKQLDIAGIFSGFETLLEEMDVVVVDVRDHGKDSSLHKLHWEILETSCPHNRPLMPRLLVRRLIMNEGSSNNTVVDESLGSARRHWNILLVVARPDKKDDIDPLLGTRALSRVSAVIKESRARLSKADVDYCGEFLKADEQKYLENYDIDFEVVRPGSWGALKEVLKVRTEAWHQSGGHGAWFDLVHFDVHGALWNNEAYLVFSSATGHKALWKSALKVGKLLTRYQVPFALLNSCNSAKATSSHLSNLARTLVKSGLHTVIAMSFKFTSSAANLFNVAFYFRLFRTPSPPDVLSALMAARGVLWRITERTGRMGQMVEIPDHIVPVMYVRDTHSSACLPWRRLSADSYKILSNLENLTTSQMATLAAENWAARSPSMDAGRQQEIVELEWLLLRTNRSNVALMTGMVGTGKTYLLRLLANWWTATTLVQSCQYVCACSTKFEEIISMLEEGREQSANLLPGGRRLIIVDHLDKSKMVSGSEKKGNVYPWTDEESRVFFSLIQSFVGGPYLVIIISRVREAYFEVPESQIYHLEGLVNYHANDLASDLLRRGGLEDAIIKEKEKSYIQYLTSRLLYNPLAITFFCEGLIAGLTNLTKAPFAIDRPSRLFDWLTTSATNGSIYYDEENSLPAQECFSFISSLCEGTTETSMKRRTMTLGLGPCNSVFHRGWLDRLMRDDHDKIPPNDLRRKMIPSRSESHNFLNDVLLKSGWMEEFDLRLSEEKVEKYIRIHPVFTNIIRRLDFQGEGRFWQDLPQNVSYLFGSYNYNRLEELLLADGKIKDVVDIPGTEKQRAVITWESLNRETVLRIQVEAANFIQGALQLIHEKQWIDAKLILLLLWEVAVRSRTPALSVEMLIGCITNFAGILKQTLVGSVTEEDFSPDQLTQSIVELSIYLSRFYMQKNPRLAKEYAEAALRLAFQYGGKIISWRPSYLTQIVMLLISYGISLLQLGKHFHQATDAFFAALRLAHCYQITPLIAFAACFGIEQVALIRGIDEESRKHLGSVQSTALLYYSANDEHKARDRDTIELSKYLLEVHFGYEFEFDLTTFLRSIRSDVDGPAMVSDIKDIALSESSEGHFRGDAMLECRGQMILAELAMEIQDWGAACQHIFRVEDLRQRFSGGRLLFNSPADRAFLWMRYGCAMLRDGELKNALFFFRMSDSDRDGKRFKGDGLEDVSNPEEFVTRAAERTRRCLDKLLKPPRLLISAAGYYELDDLMQQLVIKKLSERFPGYDIEENKVSEVLKRKYTVDYDQNSGDIRVPAREDYISTTELMSLENLTINYGEEGSADDSLMDLAMIEDELPSMEETFLDLSVKMYFWASELAPNTDHSEEDKDGV